MSPELVFERLTKSAPRLRATSAKERIAKLQRLEKNVLEMQEEITTSLAYDFGKPYEEALLTEISPVVIEIRHTIRALKSWMKSRRVGSPRVFAGTTSYVRYEPKGPSLIISPWNYAFTLTLGPIISAVAAGCPIAVKPSEYTPAAGEILDRLMNDSFEDDEVIVCHGDRHVAEALLQQPFRHIYFTGSPAVGKKVMAAAANNLASVTLELGGKSPAVVDEKADLEAAARRIAFGKFANSGQTCIAPDYLLAHHSIVDELESKIVSAIKSLYGHTTDSSNPPRDLSRMISKVHARRLIKMLQSAVDGGARIVYGGSFEEENRFIEPTLLRDVQKNASLLTEEIFGPVLPIIPYSNEDEAKSFIAAKDPPLSLYLFSENETFLQSMIESLEAGCISINETLLHFSNPDLPFGGLTSSGIGRGHGLSGFLAFSTQKAVFKQPFSPWFMSHVHPPFGKHTQRWIKALIRLS